MKSPLHSRLIYSLSSGILFLALGIVIFLRGKGFSHFFFAGLFALLIASYGIYRIAFFINLLKKEREEAK
jgi:uncharacterized membrane protein HdeD (DUF308 family)